MLHESILSSAIADLAARQMVEGYYKDKLVTVTGGSGLIGRNVVKILEGLGAKVRVIRSSDYNLIFQSMTRRAMYDDWGSNLLFHLAGSQMGIGRTSKNPGLAFFENLQMGLNVVEWARIMNLKIVYAGSVCAYPDHPPIPMTEGNLWSGAPEETNRSYGIAKRTVGEMLRAYHQQYKLEAAHLVLGNVYGPDDNFDLETSHVIPALIRKFTEAKANGVNEVTLWGSGRASRDFTYVTDTARALVLAGAHVDCPEPINVGSSIEIPIAGLAKIVAKQVGYKGEVVWDYAKPEGAERRWIRIDQARKNLYWAPKVGIDEGIAATVEWYGGSHG